MGLIARQAEAAGIATLSMSSALDITRSVNPPRAVFLDFPLGHTSGPPDRPDLQRRILVDTLEAFTAMTAPGSIKALPYQWPEDPTWHTAYNRIGDARTERAATPQYQTEEDRHRAEKNDRSALAVCSCPECRAP